MAVDRYISTLSNYVHPQESNLLNIHKSDSKKDEYYKRLMEV